MKHFFKRTVFFALFAALCFASCDTYTGSGDEETPAYKYKPTKEIERYYSHNEENGFTETIITAYDYKSETDWSWSGNTTYYQIFTGRVRARGEITETRNGAKFIQITTRTEYDEDGNKTIDTTRETTQTYYKDTEILWTRLITETETDYTGENAGEPLPSEFSEIYTITELGTENGVTSYSRERDGYTSRVKDVYKYHDDGFYLLETYINDVLAYGAEYTPAFTDGNVRHLSYRRFDRAGNTTGYSTISSDTTGNELKITRKPFDSFGPLTPQTEYYYTRVN